MQLQLHYVITTETMTPCELYILKGEVSWVLTLLDL